MSADHEDYASLFNAIADHYARKEAERIRPTGSCCIETAGQVPVGTSRRCICGNIMCGTMRSSR